MKELKFKNAVNISLYFACFFSLLVIIVSVILIALSYQDLNNCINIIIIGGSIILCFWIVVGFVLLFSGTVIVNETEIKMCRGNKIKWILEKEKIKQCIYLETKWYGYLMPSYIDKALNLEFVLHNKSVYKKSCYITYKQVKKMLNEFNYPIKIIK